MKEIPKNWRELPINKKLEIPKKHFGINEKILQNIRKIQDSKQRLIESARIQYELFEEIHSYLTAWIAGYSSDYVIRQKFGSTLKLRELFIKTPKMNKEINPSWQDIKRGIIIPDKMSEELAEEIGIHIGDGNLYMGTNKEGSRSYQYTISGDLTDEYLYHTKYIAKLMKKIYNIKGVCLKRSSKNNIDSRYKSKAIAEFKSKILKLPTGSKKDIKIPKEILDNNNFMKRCIVGIIDTDFSITSSLAISGKINNLFVAKDIHRTLKKNKIPHIYRLYERYARFYIPKKEAINIVKDWKLNNVKHLSKYKVFEKFGKFVPYTTTSERLALLDGKLEIEKLEKIAKERSLKKKISYPLFSYK